MFVSVWQSFGATALMLYVAQALLATFSFIPSTHL
jgi:hypothetical protein